MEDALREKIESGGSARLLAPYARPWKTQGTASPHDLPPSMQDFNIPYQQSGTNRSWNKVWNFVPKNGSDYATFIQGKPGSKIHADPLCEVGCPYAVRGFDWDFVGILWFSDLVWSPSDNWSVDPEHVFETGFSTLTSKAKRESDPSGPHHINLREAVAQTYRILLTRPIKEVYLWFEDQGTRKHVEKCLGRVASH